MGTAAIPIYIAIVAAIASILTPIVNGLFNKNNEKNKADAAAQFTQIAAMVAENNKSLQKEVQSLKEGIRQLLQMFEAVPIDLDEPSHEKLTKQIEYVRSLTY